MPVVLDNDAGERVLLYGTDGASLLKVLTDSSGRLVVVVNSTTGIVTVTATNLDIRDLVKTQDELYAVLRTDAGAAYDARARSWTITEDVSVVQDAAADLKAAVHGIDGSTQRQVAVDGSGRTRVSLPQERNVTQVFKAYRANGVAPHGFTERWTYTVPASKVAVVELIKASMTTDAAPTGASFAQCNIGLTPSGGSETFIYDLDFRQQTLGNTVTDTFSGALWLMAGDVIRGGTQDGSTGGTIRYYLTAAIKEFDA